MSFGISKRRVEIALKDAGIQDEKVISTVANIIEKNNVMIKAEIEDMINTAISQRLR